MSDVLDAIARAQAAQARRLGYRDAETRYDPTDEPPDEGNVQCRECGAVIAWQGELPDDCLRCGEAL